MHPGGGRSAMDLFDFEKSANLKHPSVRGVALSDTHIFILNEYFIELNTANFNILNIFLNWILLETKELIQLLNWILLIKLNKYLNWIRCKTEKWINVWIEFRWKQDKWTHYWIEFCKNAEIWPRYSKKYPKIG